MFSFILRKTIILMIACFCFQLKAQTYFGLRAGPSFSRASKQIDNSLVITDWVTGANIGLYFEFSFNQILSLQTEACFVQKGYKRRVFQVYSYRVSYFDLPILLKFKNSSIPFKKKGRKLSMYGAVGPYIGIATYGKSKGLESRRVEKMDIDSSHRDDFGLLANAGVAIPSGRLGSIFFELRYDLGLATISNSGFEKVKSHGFSPSVGYAW